MRGNGFRTVLLSCVGLLLCSLSPSSYAEVQCSDKAWSVGLYDHGVLFFDGRTGIDKDLTDEIRKRTGCPLHSRLMPRARIWHDLEQGQLDISVSGIATTERQKFAWFIPYLQMKNVVLLSPTVSQQVVQAEDFLQQTDLIFGAVRSFKHGTFHDAFLQQLDTQQRVLYYTDSITLFKALKQNRVQAIFAQAPVYRRLLPHLQFDFMPKIYDWAPAEPGMLHGLVLAKSSFSPSQMEQWRTLMQQLKQDGTLLKIYSTYLPAQEALALMPD
jgi:polar amino acid transport system substrate-binding protein